MTESTSSEAESSSRRPARTAAFAAVAVFGFLILRIFAVAAEDWDAAFLVSTALSLDDGVPLVFGSLMAGLGTVLAFALTVSAQMWWLLPTIAVVFGLLALTRRLKAKNRLRAAAATAMASVGW
ncbi:hypothetical protein [Rhodoglobus aureus]